MPFGPTRVGPGGGRSSGGSGSDDSDNESESESSSGSPRSRTPNSGGHIPGAPSDSSSGPGPSDRESIPEDQPGGPAGEGGQQSGSGSGGGPDFTTTDPGDIAGPSGQLVEGPSSGISDSAPSDGGRDVTFGETGGAGISESEASEIIGRFATQNTDLVKTGSSDPTGSIDIDDIGIRRTEGGGLEYFVGGETLKRRQQSFAEGVADSDRKLFKAAAEKEAKQFAEGVAMSDRKLYSAELKTRAERGIEAQTGREADVSISTRLEAGRLTADVVDVDLGAPVEGETATDPSAGPIAKAARDLTGDPLGGFRASVFDNREAIEESRAEAVEDLEAGAGIDFDGVLPGTPASRKSKIDSFVDKRAETALTAATIAPRAGLTLASRGAETVEDKLGVDLDKQAGEEAEKLGVAATLVPRAAASAGAEFARDGGTNTKETLAAAATVGVLAPEPASTATGIAVLGGLGVAAGAGFVSESELGVGDPTETATELGVGGQTQDVNELGVGGQSQEVTEVDLGELPQDATEVEIPVGGVSDPSTIQTSELIGLQKQRQQKPTIGEDDIITDIPEPDQAPPSVRERMQRDDLFTPVRDFPTGESAVVGRGTAQDAAEEIAQEDAAAEDALPTEDSLLGSGETLVPGVGERVGTGLDTDLPPGQTTEQVPDVAQGPVAQSAVETPGFGTPTGFGNPTEVRDPTLPGGSPSPTGRRPRPPLPDINLGTDRKKRKPTKSSDFEKDFSSPVATPEDVLNNGIAATDSSLPEEEPL